MDSRQYEMFYMSKHLRSRLFRYALTIGITMMCLLPIRGETRRAIVIGIGKQLDKSWGKINGDKDVPLVVGMLKENGFSDITTLVNEQATKTAIVSAFQSLAKRAKDGDIILIHFSGHGQLMTDLNGDENDKLDESWIPYDAYRKYCSNDRGEKHLSDDEICQYLNRLREKIGNKGEIAVVVDACHSGDSTRDLCENESVVVRGVDVDFVIPGKKSKTSSVHGPETWITLSACQDFQLNQEYNGVGKLTHILVNNWRDFVGKSDMSIYKAIDEMYETRKYKGPVAQNPQLSGKTGRVLSLIFTKK